MPRTVKGKSQDSGTVVRVIRLLKAVAERSEFKRSDIVTELKLPASTSHRLLQVLVDSGLLERTPTSSYRPSPEFFRIASLVASRFNLNSIARPFVQRVAKQFDETCSFALYVPSNRTGTIVETCPSSQQLQYVIAPYTEWTLAWGALGRAILAHLPEQDVRAVLASAPRSAATRQAAPSYRKLEAEFKQVREKGYYISANQNVLGATGTAAPVFGERGALIGSLAMVTPLARFDAALQPQITAAIVASAQALSAALRHHLSRD